MNTLEQLEERILANENYTYKKVTVENLGQFICGVNWKFAYEPFSREFLNNVAFNTDSSMAAIIWLQLNHIS